MSSRVMVVDDDLAILELLTSLLESEGYQVQAFDSALAALQAAETQLPDAAIVDLMMPEMNGQDLVHALRDNPRTHDLPVLICSAYYGELRRALLELGPENIAQLRKPFHIDELLDLVARLASGAGPRPEATPAPASLQLSPNQA